MTETPTTPPPVEPTPPPAWNYGPPPASPVVPMPGYFPPAPPPRKRHKWPFVLGGVVLLLGAGAGAVFGLGVIGGSSHTVDVQITDDVSGGCSLAKGATITLKDEHGTVLGTTELSGGTGDGAGGCTYDQKISGVTDDASQYTETNDVIGGSVTFTHDQLATHGWIFPIETYSR